MSANHMPGRNYRAEATVFEPAPSAQQLIGSVLSLIGEDIRGAAALDIEAAIQLRIQAERDALKAQVVDLIAALEWYAKTPDGGRGVFGVS